MHFILPTDQRAGHPQWRHPASEVTTAPTVSNVLDCVFAVAAPDRVWACDITYIRTWQGWLYLAVVIDLFSRRVVGWSMQGHMRTDLVLDALTMAVGQRFPGPGLLSHSDRGAQLEFKGSSQRGDVSRSLRDREAPRRVSSTRASCAGDC